MAGLEPDTLEMTLDAIGDFAAHELPEKLLIDLDERDEFPAELIKRMCSEDLGVQLLFIPEEHGGMGGSAFDVYRVCERMAAIDLGVATSVLATFLGSDPIVVGGTPDQQALWLGRIAAEGILMAYGATEPEAGSDLGAMKTVAVPVKGEDGAVTAYRITGKKQWISNGGVADLYTILANAPGGPSWFVVDRDTPGFALGKPENKHGIRLSNTAALFLDEVEVPADRLVGGVEGQGLVQAQLVFGYTRLMVAAFGLGAGWAALDRATPYCDAKCRLERAFCITEQDWVGGQSARAWCWRRAFTTRSPCRRINRFESSTARSASPVTIALLIPPIDRRWTASVPGTRSKKLPGTIAARTWSTWMNRGDSAMRNTCRK